MMTSLRLELFHSEKIETTSSDAGVTVTSLFKKRSRDLACISLDLTHTERAMLSSGPDGGVPRFALPRLDSPRGRDRAAVAAVD